MATTKKSDILSGDQILADAIIAFVESGVMTPLVMSANAPKGSGTVKFPYYGDPASSNVGSATDGSDYTTTTTRTVSGSTATLAEYVVRSDVSDLANQTSPQNIYSDVGSIIGQELALKADDLLVSLFSGFSQTEAGDTVTLTLDHVFGASRQLHASGSPMPFNLVLSPKQIWGGKGIQNLLVHTNSGSQVADNRLSQEMLSSGMVGQLAGNAVYWSGEINENVGSGGDAAGAMFSRGALGIGFSSAGPVKVAQQRDESARLTEFIGIMVAGVIEVKDTFGVYILTDVS